MEQKVSLMILTPKYGQFNCMHPSRGKPFVQVINETFMTILKLKLLLALSLNSQTRSVKSPQSFRTSRNSCRRKIVSCFLRSFIDCYANVETEKCHDSMMAQMWIWRQVHGWHHLHKYSHTRALPPFSVLLYCTMYASWLKKHFRMKPRTKRSR